jgi:hypothetical protein
MNRSQILRAGTASLLRALAFELLACSAISSLAAPYPPASDLPVQTAMPDPLVRFDGRRIASKDEWLNERRPELKRLFAHYMYGEIPPKPTQFAAQKTGEYTDFLGGKATLRLVTLQTGPGHAPKIDLMLVVPNHRSKPAPVFLAMNFCGNHALTADPRVPLVRGWVYSSCKGCANGHATESSRGSQVSDWPLKEIVSRGYALASFCSSDIDSDQQEVSEGLYAWLSAGDPAANNPTNRGTIAAWAWGFMRGVDYLVADPDLDAHRIAALGHSRNGKTALLAAAFDERIAIAFPHQAGMGGSAPSRGKTGESVKAINDRFPHWFGAGFKPFNNAPERLPFDQNCLVALCAPRPVFFSAAEDDQWANPAGQFEVLKAADPVYRFLGVEGLSAQETPPVGTFIGSRLGYFYRPGKHSLTPADWDAFLKFADLQFGIGKNPQ